MQITSDLEGNTLSLRLAGRLDGSNAAQLAAAVEQVGVPNLVLDLQECGYVSSAGLREFLKAQRRMSAAGGSLLLVNVSSQIMSVLDVTGFLKFLQVRAMPREISMEGLEFLSAGVCGEVFRLDAETIVKLYKAGLPATVAEKEKEYATAAFVAGIPTAISYDVVRSAERTGVIYEMLDAKQLSALIRENPGDLDRYARLYAGIVRGIHQIDADPQVFPDLKAQLRNSLEESRQWLRSGDVDLLLQRLVGIPDAQTFVHFDIHTSNIMLRDGEPLIIDMGDVSRGSGLFDVGLVRVIYGYPELGISEMATKVPNGLGERLWKAFATHYFEERSEERKLFERNQHFLASLRGIYTLCWHPEMRERLVGQVNEVFMPLIRGEAGAK